MKKIISLLLVLCMVLGMSVSAFAAETATINSLKELQNALNSNVTDIIINGKIVISGNVTLSGLNITRSATYTGTLFEIPSDCTLVIQNSTVDGGNEWTFNVDAYESDLKSCTVPSDYKAYVIPENDVLQATANMFVNSGVLSLQSSTIKNHCGMGGTYSVIKGKAGSKTTVDDTDIYHCASGGDGVVIHFSEAGTADIINGSTFTDNYAIGNGAVIHAYGGATVTLSDSTIDNNRACNSNGTAVGAHGSSFKMRGNSVISNNSSVSGANNGQNCAVTVWSNGTFVMENGRIENNIGGGIGGVDFRGGAAESTVLSGGYIGNNVASNKEYSYREEMRAGKDITVGKQMTFEGNIYVYGSVTNNGTIIGDITIMLPENYTGDPSNYFVNNGTYTGTLYIKDANGETIHTESFSNSPYPTPVVPDTTDDSWYEEEEEIDTHTSKSDMAEYIDDLSKKDDTVTVELLSDDDTIGYSALKLAAEEGLSVELDGTDDGYFWRFALEEAALEGFKGSFKSYVDIDAGLSTSLKKILKDSKNYQIFKTEHEGKVPDTTTLGVKLIKELRSADELYLYLWNSDDKRVEEMNVTMYKEGNYLCMEIPHYSTYIITDAPISGAVVVEQGTAVTAPIVSVDKANPETGASDLVGMAAALAVVSVLGGAALSLKK